MTAKNGGGNGESSSWGVVAMAETHAPPPPPPSGRGASLLPIQPSFFSVHFLMQMTARSDPPLGLWYQLFCMAWVSVHRRSSASSFFFFLKFYFFRRRHLFKSPALLSFPRRPLAITNWQSRSRDCHVGEIGRIASLESLESWLLLLSIVVVEWKCKTGACFGARRFTIRVTLFPSRPSALDFLPILSFLPLLSLDVISSRALAF